MSAPLESPRLSPPLSYPYRRLVFLPALLTFWSVSWNEPASKPCVSDPLVLCSADGFNRQVEVFTTWEGADAFARVMKRLGFDAIKLETVGR